MLDQQPLQAGHQAAAVGAGQMEVRAARGVRRPARGMVSDVALQQVQLLAEFPDAAAERVEQRALAKLRHASAELPQAGGLVPEGGGIFPPFGRIPGQQAPRAFEEGLGLWAFLVRQVVAVAEEDQVLQRHRLADGREARQPFPHRGEVSLAGVPLPAQCTNSASVRSGT